ncbi:MAG: hypothetical protein IKB34_07840 [Clostridia bacterium]|nr:hypothetical protein [Clostridia bacterium]
MRLPAAARERDICLQALACRLPNGAYVLIPPLACRRAGARYMPAGACLPLAYHLPAACLPPRGSAIYACRRSPAACLPLACRLLAACLPLACYLPAAARERDICLQALACRLPNGAYVLIPPLACRRAGARYMPAGARLPLACRLPALVVDKLLFVCPAVELADILTDDL